jgi:predicted DNA-binding transcriptional regulator AlpA
VSQKQIPFVKIGGRKVMFDKEEIEKWIDDQGVEPIPVDEKS